MFALLLLLLSAVLVHAAAPVPTAAFPGVVFDAPLQDELVSGTAVLFSGYVEDAAVADGQILLRFTPENGEPTRVFIPLQDVDFRRYHIFTHAQVGVYELDIFLGGAGDESLIHVGSFSPLNVVEGSGPIELPVDFFPGVVLDQLLSAELPLERDIWIEGRTATDAVAVHLEVEGEEVFQQLQAGVVEGRFRLLLRLGREQRGALVLRLYREGPDGAWTLSGELPVLAVEASPAPHLQLGALALNLRPAEVVSLPIFNAGQAGLNALDIQVIGPFSIIDSPTALPAAGRADIRVRYDGSGGDSGLLRLFSDDPQRSVQEVALSGQEQTEMDLPFLRREADAQGAISLDLDLDRSDYLLVLYSGAIVGVAEDARFAYSVGGPLPAARLAAVSAPAPVGRLRGEGLLRAREGLLAKAYRRYDGPRAKRAAINVEVGDRRRFVYGGFDGGESRGVDATAVYVGSRAVAWLQDDLRAHEDNLSAEQVVEVVDLFSREDYATTVEAFGRASDVDGDESVAFLFTHWVDDEEGVAGFYAATSVLPTAVGGDGNVADLMFVSPTQDLDFYRSLLVHEFQHLINFNEHVLVRRGEAEASWLNEGLSHLAEDLVATYAESGQSENIAAYLRAPERVGLIGDAADNAALRGAAYLFVRSLRDRLGSDIIRRLVGTGWADRVNVEQATGRPMDELLAYWGTQLYASGQGVSGHPQFNFSSPLLQSAGRRGLPLPAVRSYAVGAPPFQGHLPARGLSFVRVRGGGVESLSIAGESRGQMGVVAIPLRDGFISSAYVPVDYVAGLHFDQPLPAVMVVGRAYQVAGDVLDGRLRSLLFRFSGADTLRFDIDVTDGRFEQVWSFADVGEYELEVFVGDGEGPLDFVAGFAPIWVAAASEITAVEAVAEALPGSYVLGKIYPNPFNASAILPFTVPTAPGKMSLVVYNALGQKVRTLFRGMPSPGHHAVSWDGRDDAGRALSSGVYWYRLQSATVQQVGAAVLLR